LTMADFHCFLKAFNKTRTLNTIRSSAARIQAPPLMKVKRIQMVKSMLYFLFDLK
jgi:hypothetical protein